MNEDDARIIEVLSRNSKTSFRKIAKETGLSTDTVMRRYQRLEKENVIQPTITVDLQKLGYEAIVFFALKVTSQASLPTVVEEAAKIPDVTAVIKATGEYDLQLIACARNIRHIFEIWENIAGASGIRKVSLGQIQLLPAEKFNFPPPYWHNLYK